MVVRRTLDGALDSLRPRTAALAAQAGAQVDAARQLSADARAAYAAALAGYASGTPAGVAGWLVHCCRATEHGALEGLAICESLLRG